MLAFQASQGGSPPAATQDNEQERRWRNLNDDAAFNSFHSSESKALQEDLCQSNERPTLASDPSADKRLRAHQDARDALNEARITAAHRQDDGSSSAATGQQDGPMARLRQRAALASEEKQ